MLKPTRDLNLERDQSVLNYASRPPHQSSVWNNPKRLARLALLIALIGLLLGPWLLFALFLVVSDA